MDQDKVLLNEDAWGYLDDAMFTSSLISDKERQKGEVDDVEDIYPRTKEEALYMDEQLQHAMETAKEPNEENFAERYGMLREIVDWSLKRHSTWKWSLIAGALLGAGIFYYFKKDDYDAAKDYCEKVLAIDPNHGLAKNILNAIAQLKK